jgi:hypothetical protein
MVERAEGRWRSFDFAFVAQMQDAADQQGICGFLEVIAGA